MLILAQVLGGVLGWALPAALAWPLYDLHRALGVALIMLLGWKQAIVFNSLRRRLRPGRTRGWDRSVLWGSIAGLALIATLSVGMAWTLNLISFDWLWGYSPLNIHVIVGIALLPFLGWHLLLRRRQTGITVPVRPPR